MKTKRMLAMIVLAAVMLSGCGISFSGFRAKAERHEALSEPLAAGGRLTADTSFGGIKVRGADVQTCDVQAHIKVQAGSQEKADAILEEVFVILESTDDGLTLRVDKPRLGNNQSVGVTYDIVLPHKTHLDCTTSFGTINVQDTEGDIKAKTSFGSIHCDRVTGVLDLKTSHGKIDMDEVLASKIMADTSFGSIRLACKPMALPPARVHLETSHGSIKATGVQTPVLDAKSSFGSVSVAYVPDGPADLDVRLSSSHGSLTLTPPEAFAGRVELSTSHGSIHMDRPVTVQGKLSKDHITGTLGDGEGHISMKTSFASVNLH